MILLCSAGRQGWEWGLACVPVAPWLELVLQERGLKSSESHFLKGAGLSCRIFQHRSSL